MQFKVKDNLEGEHAFPCACVLDVTEMPVSSELAGVATFDPRRLWVFIRGIKRRHPNLFEKDVNDPSRFMTVALLRRNGCLATDKEQDLTMLVHLDGEMFGLAPKLNDQYVPVFASPSKEVAGIGEFDRSEITHKALNDYHAYLSDLADEYWAQAESRKNETDRSSTKLMMELRHMHAFYSAMADELLRYINTI